MEKNQLINIFYDTLEKSKKFQPGKTWKYSSFESREVTPGKSNIIVENIDTVSAAVKYSKLGKTCVLNMASYKRPGGGVERGSSAQEESLFRCSNLWDSISNSYYPLKQSEFLYTEGTTFFKNRYYEYMEPIVVDVVTIAAININEIIHFYGKNRVSTYSELNRILDYENITKDKIRSMLSAGIEFEVRNIVLGAWGCGVFKNDPQKMASFFKEVIDEGYGSYFDNIVFAVINDHNSVGSNYEIFKNILTK